MNEITNSFISYEAYRTEVGIEIKAAQQSMVRIGYLLKVARDTDILQGSVYKNYLDFAQEEFGLEKSTVSRFININDKFSEGGNSEKLLGIYEGFGRAKLQEMLMLPDYINEELTPELTREDIKAIRQEVEAETKVSDIEVMLEKTEGEEKGLTERFVRAILENDIAMARRIRAAGEHEAIKGIMMPDEVRYFTERIQGLGRVMMTLKKDGDHTLTNVRNGEKEKTTWAKVLNAVEYVLQDPEIGKEEVKEEPDEKEKVAPVQPKKESKVHASKKQKKEEQKEEFTAMPEPTEEPEVVNWNDTKEEPEETEEQEVPFPDDAPPEGSHEWNLQKMTNQELEKEAVACADQIRIDIYHFKSIEDMNWLEGAKIEHEKLAKTIEEIERRANNGTWRT